MLATSLKIPCGKHANISKSTKRWLRKVKNVEGIKKIIWGFSSNKRHSKKPGTAKFKKYTDTGLNYLIYTENGVRDIFIIVDCDKKDIRKKIKNITKE
jgi:hypothetical protein